MTTSQTPRPAIHQDSRMTANTHEPARENTPSSSKSPTTPRHEEYQYLDLIQLILGTGEHRPDRTGTGTLSLFAPAQLRFSLSK